LQSQFYSVTIFNRFYHLEKSRRDLMKRLLMVISLTFLLCLVLTTVSVNTLADEKEERERFTGNVIARPTGHSPRFNMIVDRWTTPEEVKQLYNLIKDVDTTAKFKAVRKKTVGYIWFINSARFPLNMASTTDTEKGRQIRLIIEHPILPGEIYRSLPAPDNQFAAVEFTLNENNEGNGYVFGRVTISINEDGTIGFKPLASIKQMLKTVRKK
jgi:hypothetical protein